MFMEDLQCDYRVVSWYRQRHTKMSLNIQKAHRKALCRQWHHNFAPALITMSIIETLKVLTLAVMYAATTVKKRTRTECEPTTYSVAHKIKTGTPLLVMLKTSFFKLNSSMNVVWIALRHFLWELECACYRDVGWKCNLIFWSYAPSTIA